MTTAATFQERQQEIVDEFGLFEDWMGRYEHIIELGRTLPPLDEAHRTEHNLVRGCQSRVWLHGELQGGALHFEADSEALITKGLVALMLRVFNDVPPEVVAEAPLFFIEQIGLKEHLSPTRSNGLVSMVRRIRAYGRELIA